jgi:hypothetical protein
VKVHLNITLGLFVLLAGLSARAAQAESGHENQHSAPSTVSSRHVPSLKILFPEPGDIVGTQLAVVFTTPADLQKMTMDAPVPGVHLHIQCDDLVLMPTSQQLIKLGKRRYLYLFDLPATPGVKKLRIYWSDAQHQTIESKMQEVSVMVATEPAR